MYAIVDRIERDRSCKLVEEFTYLVFIFFVINLYLYLIKIV